MASIAEAQAHTDIEAALAHADAVRNHASRG